MAREIDNIQYPTAEEIRDAYLRRLRLHAASNGIILNVSDGSADWYRADSFARRLQIIIANGDSAKNALSLLYSQGDDLIIVASQFGVTRLPATKASGYVKVRTTTPTATASIPAGYEATGPNGETYVTTSATVVTDNSLVHIESTAAGANKNLNAGDSITWSSNSVPFLRSSATVDISEIDGGTDDEALEDLRQRAIEKLANPAAGGNAAQIRQWAEESSNAVRNAYVYACARGPDTYDVALTGLTDDKTLDSRIVAEVSNYINERMPGFPDLNTTTITPQEVDMAYSADLPLPSAYGGVGGGWKDAVPWPTDATLITGYSTTSQQITVSSSDAPQVGNHIAIWDPSDSTLYRYVVVAVSTVSQSVTLTLQGGILHDVATGQIVSCDAELLDEYVATIAVEFDKFGPGEKIDVGDPAYADVFSRARRYPIESTEDPIRVTNNIVSKVISAHPEFLDFVHHRTWETGTYSTSLTSPTVQPTVADPPNALVAKNIGVFAI